MNFRNYKRCHPVFYPDDFLRFMMNIYAPISDATTLLQRFYAMEQSKMENIAKWATTLMDVYSKIVEHYPDKIQQEERYRDGLLRERFWRGLRDSRIQEALRSDYKDRPGDFTDLVSHARRVEQEMLCLPSHVTTPRTAGSFSLQNLGLDDSSDTSFIADEASSASSGMMEPFLSAPVQSKPNTKTKVPPTTIQVESDVMTKLLARISAIEADLREVKAAIKPETAPHHNVQANSFSGTSSIRLPSPGRGRCWACGDPSHYQNRCPHRGYVSVPPYPRGRGSAPLNYSVPEVTGVQATPSLSGQDRTLNM
jgi:hypothetical protein